MVVTGMKWRWKTEGRRAMKNDQGQYRSFWKNYSPLLTLSNPLEPRLFQKSHPPRNKVIPPRPYIDRMETCSVSKLGPTKTMTLNIQYKKPITTLSQNLMLQFKCSLIPRKIDYGRITLIIHHLNQKVQDTWETIQPNENRSYVPLLCRRNGV